jgi:hypothetical protein
MMEKEQHDRSPGELIAEAINEGRGVDGLEERHLQRMHIVRETPNDVIFEVERHPHLFGRRSTGLPSSAYIKLQCTYRLDKISGDIEFVSSKDSELIIDWEILVEEELELLVDYGGVTKTWRRKSRNSAVGTMLL